MEKVRQILEKLDACSFERKRLGILLILAEQPMQGNGVRRPLTFMKLRKGLGMTDGNLSVHLRKLREAGLVERWFETPDARRPVSVYLLTLEGAKALAEQIDCLDELVKQCDGPR